ncbi:hypothetical protein RI534_21135, partial [Aeromonas allosaccharophila]
MQAKRTKERQSITNLLILDRFCAVRPFYPLPDWIACFTWQPAPLHLIHADKSVLLKDIFNKIASKI